MLASDSLNVFLALWNSIWQKVPSEIYQYYQEEIRQFETGIYLYTVWGAVLSIHVAF